MNQPITATELGELLDAHANSLRLYVAQWANSPDDCVQESFVQLAAQKNKPDNPLAWLYQVARRRALNQRRSSKRRLSREKAIARNDVSQCDPADQILKTESQQAIQRTLDGLPAESRELIVLRIWSGLKWKEIAELTGCSTSAAQRRFAAALELMKETLEPSCLMKPK